MVHGELPIGSLNCPEIAMSSRFLWRLLKNRQQIAMSSKFPAPYHSVTHGLAGVVNDIDSLAMASWRNWDGSSHFSEGTTDGVLSVDGDVQ